MIESDLRAKIIGDAAVSALIGSGSSARMYLKKPIRTPSQTYLTYHRQNKARDMVSEVNRFRIIAFSQDTLELENLCTAVINALEGETDLNGNEYFSNSFLSQTDSEAKLEDGFFWSILTFEFKHTT